MNTFEDYIEDALTIVGAWDLENEEFSAAVNSQARLMSGMEPSDFYDRDDPETYFSCHR